MSLILPRRALLKAGAAALITSPAIIGKAAAQLGGGLMFPGPGTPHSAGGGGSPFTWNPADAAPSVTLANSNRDFTGTGSGSFSSVRTTLGKTSGVWYCEFIVANTVNQPALELGVANATFALTTGDYLGNSDKSAGYFWSNQASFNSAAITVANAIPATQNITTGDLIQLLMDLSTATGKVWLGQNNVWKTTLVTNPWLTFTVGSDTWFFSGMQNLPAGNASAATATLPATTTGTVPGGASVINA